MSQWAWVIGAVSLLLTGCTTIHGITPVYPKVRSAVDSLRPVFRWKPTAEPDVRYDFVIYERAGIKGLPRGWMGIGKEIYYRESLMEPQHMVDEHLQPSRWYYWSVRARRGQNVSEWSRFDEVECAGFVGAAACYKEEHPFFMFWTPDK